MEDLPLVLLGHAAQHADNRVRPLLLEFFEPAQGTIDLVFGVLPHAARIQQDGVGLVGAIGRFVTRLQELGGHQFAVQNVHLAADRLDIESLGHTLHSSRGTPGARIGKVFGRLGGAVVVLACWGGSCTAAPGAVLHHVRRPACIRNGSAA